MTEWILVASTAKETHVAQTTINEPSLLYRAISKWLIRGGASKILDSFWEYIDQYDNELENALLDQLLTQAETHPQDPQITNVRTKDYSIDMTVLAKDSNSTTKHCQIDFVLYVYFQSLKKKIAIDQQKINLFCTETPAKLERVTIMSNTKTPAAHIPENRRVKKRSSKVTVPQN